MNNNANELWFLQAVWQHFEKVLLGKKWIICFHIQLKKIVLAQKKTLVSAKTKPFPSAEANFSSWIYIFSYVQNYRNHDWQSSIFVNFSLFWCSACLIWLDQLGKKWTIFIFLRQFKAISKELFRRVSC